MSFGEQELGTGEEPWKFQIKQYSEDSVAVDVGEPELALPVDGRPTLSGMEQTTYLVRKEIGKNHEWQCDYPNCGRQYQMRHDLK